MIFENECGTSVMLKTYETGLRKAKIPTPTGMFNKIELINVTNSKTNAE